MGDPTSPFRSLLARVQRAQRDVRGGLTDEQRLYLINHAVQRASRGHLGARKLVAEMRVAIPALSSGRPAAGNEKSVQRRHARDATVFRSRHASDATVKAP
jgi:hypothetical protein